MKNKRFLITQNSLRMLAGSELVTLELASYLQSQGAKVIVYTCFFGNPIKNIFDKRNIEVIDKQDAKLELKDFDYIWVHHQILPKSILEGLSKRLPENMPKFIFFHMSKLDYVPLEQPFIFGLEEKIASKIIFNSQETKDSLIDRFFSDLSNNFELFRNPAPVEFSKLPNHTYSKTPKNILVVSNHLCPEIIEVKEKLQGQRVNVVGLGDGLDKNSIISAEYLSTFDLVITIGKTVQYCLCANVPVYVYDHFGGPGYLSEDNIKIASDYNFSGRGFSKKTSKQIIKEIIDGYSIVVKFQMDSRGEFIKMFSINNILSNMLNNIKEKKIYRLDDEKYVNYLFSISRLVFSNMFDIHKLISDNILNLDRLSCLTRELSYCNKKNLNNNDEIVKRDKNILSITKSRSYKIGKFITAPYRFFKGGL